MWKIAFGLRRVGVEIVRANTGSRIGNKIFVPPLKPFKHYGSKLEKERPRRILILYRVNVVPACLSRDNLAYFLYSNIYELCLNDFVDK